jgi:uncharacterized protein with NAD-binding domain and iron-sulfur cluster
MAQISKILDIPVIATQQVNFGPIDEIITQHHHENVAVFEKKTFSMFDDQVNAHFKTLNRKSAILYGIEAHVCVR